MATNFDSIALSCSLNMRKELLDILSGINAEDSQLPTLPRAERLMQRAETLFPVSTSGHSLAASLNSDLFGIITLIVVPILSWLLLSTSPPNTMIFPPMLIRQEILESK